MATMALTEPLVSTFDRTQKAAARIAMAAAIVRSDLALMFCAAESRTPLKDSNTLSIPLRGSAMASAAVFTPLANLFRATTRPPVTRKWMIPMRPSSFSSMVNAFLKPLPMAASAFPMAEMAGPTLSLMDWKTGRTFVLTHSAKASHFDLARSETVSAAWAAGAVTACAA